MAITQHNYHYVPGLKPKVSLQSSANISCLADLRTARPSSVISKSQPQARDTCGRPTALGNHSDRVAPWCSRHYAHIKCRQKVGLEEAPQNRTLPWTPHHNADVGKKNPRVACPLGLEVGDVSLRWEKQTNHYSLYIIIIYICVCVICMLYNLHCSQIHISLLTAACCCYPATRPTPASKWERSCNSNDLPIVPSAVLGLQGHCVWMWSKFGPKLPKILYGFSDCLLLFSVFANGCVPDLSRTNPITPKCRKHIAHLLCKLLCTLEWRKTTE